jgi:hypothetical protein
MLLNVKLGNVHLPITAPRGAAAYYVTCDKRSNTACIIFGMQQDNERGIDTLNRLIKTEQKYSWKPVATRPELQAPNPDAGGGFVGYDFAYADHQWSAANPDLVSFLRGAGVFTKMPGLAPQSLRRGKPGGQTP